jgi:hypothetical protein
MSNRDPDYFIEDGNVVILVQDTLFKVTSDPFRLLCADYLASGSQICSYSRQIRL